MTHHNIFGSGLTDFNKLYWRIVYILDSIYLISCTDRLQRTLCDVQLPYPDFFHILVFPHYLGLFTYPGFLLDFIEDLIPGLLLCGLFPNPYFSHILGLPFPILFPYTGFLQEFLECLILGIQYCG